MGLFSVREFVGKVDALYGRIAASAKDGVIDVSQVDPLSRKSIDIVAKGQPTIGTQALKDLFDQGKQTILAMDGEAKVSGAPKVHWYSSRTGQNDGELDRWELAVATERDPNAAALLSALDAFDKANWDAQRDATIAGQAQARNDRVRRVKAALTPELEAQIRHDLADLAWCQSHGDAYGYTLFFESGSRLEPSQILDRMIAGDQIWPRPMKLVRRSGIWAGSNRVGTIDQSSWRDRNWGSRPPPVETPQELQRLLRDELSVIQASIGISESYNVGNVR